MKRTFNYTGRKKIERRDVSVTIREERATLLFDAELRLAAYQFPRNAEVWLEAHRQNLWMQFAWGTVSTLRVPADRKLAEFDVSDGILFRVRVVQPQGQEHHKLLGETDGIHFIKVASQLTAAGLCSCLCRTRWINYFGNWTWRMTRRTCWSMRRRSQAGKRRHVRRTSSRWFIPKFFAGCSRGP
jgi:hypothetical protein